MLLSGSVNRTVGPTYVLTEEAAAGGWVSEGGGSEDFDPHKADGDIGTMGATAQLPTLEHSEIA